MYHELDLGCGKIKFDLIWLIWYDSIIHFSFNAYFQKTQPIQYMKREDTVCFPQCIASNTIFCTGYHVSM